MALRFVSKKTDFDRLTLKFGKMLKRINLHILVILPDIQMRFELVGVACWHCGSALDS